MKKFLSILLLLVAVGSVSVQASDSWPIALKGSLQSKGTDVTDLSKLSSSKVYYLSNERGALCYVSSVSTTHLTTNFLVQTANALTDDTDLKPYQFAILESGTGTYYLYSIAAQKYITNNGKITVDDLDGSYTGAVLSDDPTEFSLSASTYDSKTGWFHIALGSNQNWLNISDSGDGAYGLLISDYKTEDAGNSLYITEATDETFDATALLVAIDKKELKAALDECNAVKNSIGKRYTYKDGTEENNTEFTNNITTAQGVYDATDATSEQVAAQTKTLKAMIAALKDNTPQVGTFIRIRSYNDDDKCYVFLSNSNTTVTKNGTGVSRMTYKQRTDGENDAETIFYYAPGTTNSLINYSTGYYFTQNTSESKFQPAYNGILESGAGISFAESVYDGSTTSGNWFVVINYTGDDTKSQRILYASKENYADAGDKKITEDCKDARYTFDIQTVEKLPVKVTYPAKYASLYAPVNLVVPEGVTIYAAGKLDGTKSELTAITSTQGDILPANTGYLVYADVTATTTYEFTITSDAATVTVPTSNALTGTVPAKNIDEATAAYALGYKSRGTGFYCLKDQSTGLRYIPGFRAYTIYDGTTAEAAPAFMSFDFDGETTGISSANIDAANTADAPIFDLTGRKVSKAGKGIYIIGGKKVIK